MGNNAFIKDIIRTLKNNVSRFIAIMIMATLGMGVFSGFAAGCNDVLEAADDFYKHQNNYDIQIVSTLGLTKEDMSAASVCSGVKSVYGNVSMEVKAEQPNDELLLANLTTLDQTGMNKPYLQSGQMPAKSGEIAVDSKFIKDSGLKIGDTIYLQEAEPKDKKQPEIENSADGDSDDNNDFSIDTENDSPSPSLALTEYRITAVVMNPLDISNSEGGATSASYSNAVPYTMFVTSDAVISDIYTSVYLTVSGADTLDTYSAEYGKLIDQVSGNIKRTIQEKRQQARYDEVVTSANQKIADGEKILQDKMNESEQKMNDAQKEIDDGFIKLNKGKEEIKAKESDLINGEKAFKEQKEKAEQEFVKAQKEIDENLLKLNSGEAELKKQKEETVNKFADLEQKTADEAALNALKNQKAVALEKLNDAEKEIETGKAKLISGQKALNDNKAKLVEAENRLKDGRKKLEDGKKELSDSEIKLNNGQKELDENRAKYNASIAKAQKKLSNAKSDVSEIEMTKWYVWDRTDNKSFAGIKSDMNFIRAVTTAFPVIFFLVAVLICLTTMTRMVEEDRGLIGTYKSLGYSKFRISLKYMVYVILACVIGGILGSVIGFIGLPLVIKIIFSGMYTLPFFRLNFYLFYAISGFGLFMLGIAGATVLSCGVLLHHCPAELMRPKAPKAGTRILLEYIPFLWKNLNFLQKVTCRNLLRYKKRAFMTLIGIAGCTMLIVLGFGLRDTVGGLMPDQYGKTTVYDAIVVTDSLNKNQMTALSKEWSSQGEVSSALEIQISAMTLSGKSEHTDITVMIIPEGSEIQKFVHLTDLKTNKEAVLPENSIVVTQNAAKKLSLKGGDKVSLLNDENIQHDFSVAFVAKNYIGNYVYMSETCYRNTFKDFEPSAFLLNLSDKVEGQKWLKNLKNDDRILSVNSSQETIDSFGEINLDMVIYLLIAMSAVLALAVLFTLSNINISERERELATIKVLGFQRKEVNSYVNKETTILSVIGILFGLPAGYGITYGILGNLSIANIAFQVRVSPLAYFIAFALTLTFTLLVNKITNKGLRKINMVEALKSVE